MIFRNVWFLSRFGIESLQKHDRCMTNKKAKVKITDQIKDAIRNEYVQGVELDTGERSVFTLDELIAKYNVSSTTIYRLSAKDGWKMQREEFRHKLMAEFDEKRREQLSDESIKVDEISLKLSYEIFAHVQSLIKSNEKPSGVASLSMAAINAQKLAKLALGEATENMKLNANIQETDAFREAMELLDEVERQRRNSSVSTTH
jgi:hypothetical protein